MGVPPTPTSLLPCSTAIRIGLSKCDRTGLPLTYRRAYSPLSLLQAETSAHSMVARYKLHSTHHTGAGTSCRAQCTTTEVVPRQRRSPGEGRGTGQGRAGPSRGLQHRGGAGLLDRRAVPAGRSADRRAVPAGRSGLPGGPWIVIAGTAVRPPRSTMPSTSHSASLDHGPFWEPVRRAAPPPPRGWPPEPTITSPIPPCPSAAI